VPASSVCALLSRAPSSCPSFLLTFCLSLSLAVSLLVLPSSLSVCTFALCSVVIPCRQSNVAFFSFSLTASPLPPHRDRAALARSLFHCTLAAPTPSFNTSTLERHYIFRLPPLLFSSLLLPVTFILCRTNILDKV